MAGFYRAWKESPPLQARALPIDNESAVATLWRSEPALDLRGPPVQPKHSSLGIWGNTSRHKG
jgi:hypothetical protein